MIFEDLIIPGRMGLRDDPDIPEGDAHVQFRLTYSGPILSHTSSNGRPEHKHDIRRCFHQQLATLWKIHPGLKMHGASGVLKYRFDEYCPRVWWLAEQYERCGYAFVPLITESASVYCDLNILMLRPDLPGTLIRSGDLDNRVKTILDALKIPKDLDEMGKSGPAQADELPFFCLLEDDKLISRFVIEADTILETMPKSEHPENDARLVITVDIKPYTLRADNAHF